MTVAKQILDAKITEQKKANTDAIVGLNTLREEDKFNYIEQGKRFEATNIQFKEKNKMYNNLKYDFDELDVNHNTTLIKLQDLQRQYENLTNKTATLSDRLNDIEFKNGNLTRDLETAKDIAESKAINNKKLVDKLVNDLKTVDARWEKIMNENTMVCEDFR